ncbi:DUF6678 family protein [Aestuariivirga sp.]|uniref:DUF6678 family protein n=1 Tax=Aestuariivirga sp. TaxID=2650926 RepID=UPI0039E6B192
MTKGGHFQKVSFHEVVPPNPAIHAVMNNTKWNELRLAMYNIEPAPRWSTLATNGFQSSPDREWFYHFRNGRYEGIVHVDIFADNPQHGDMILAALRKIHVPGEKTPDGFRVYGYRRDGQTIGYV